MSNDDRTVAGSLTRLAEHLDAPRTVDTVTTRKVDSFGPAPEVDAATVRAGDWIAARWTDYTDSDCRALIEVTEVTEARGVVQVAGQVNRRGLSGTYLPDVVALGAGATVRLLRRDGVLLGY